MTKKSLLIYSSLTILMIAIVWVAVEASIWSTGGESDRVMLLDVPMIVKPRTVKADEINIKDDSQVIGIVNNDMARAYVLASFVDKRQHVVNDVVGDKAYTLTYCDLNDCVKVFKNSNGNAPLDVKVGGWIGTNLHGSLLLQVGSTLYNQSTGKSISSDKAFPYEATTSYERMTWKEWKTKHPNTEVYYQGSAKTFPPVPNQ